MILALNVRDVAKRQRDGIRNFVAHADAVERRGKLARVRRGDKQNDHRDRRQILEQQIEVVEQLLLRDHIRPRDGKEHRL